MTEISMFPEIIEPVFVFGSNELGIHGKGAALFAKQHHGAIQGIGEGYQGNSYAIPTKITPYTVRPLDKIANSVVTFLEFALAHPELTFRVTAIGCGYAGYQPRDIAWMFDLPPPSNVILPDEFKAIIG